MLLFVFVTLSIYVAFEEVNKGVDFMAMGKLIAVFQDNSCELTILCRTCSYPSSISEVVSNDRISP